MNTHWACQKCLVQPMCSKKCYRKKLYHPYCDILCTEKEQIECTGVFKQTIISCTKVGKRLIAEGKFFSHDYYIKK